MNQTYKPNENSRKPNKPNKDPKFNVSWIYIAVLSFLFVAYFFSDKTTFTMPQDFAYSDFQQMVRKDQVEKVVVMSDKTVEVSLRDSAVVAVLGQEAATAKRNTIEVTAPSVDEVAKFLTENQFSGKVEYKEHSNYVYLFLINVLPFMLFIFFIFYMNRRMMGGEGGMFGVGKSKAKLFDKDSAEQQVTFADVAGLQGAKEEVEEIVSFLKNPQKYTVLGGKIPKGALLVGPPGTGKTLLAKAVAGEANVPFFSMSGSDFVEMFVGVGASRVRDLFRQAKEKAPCIVFIDEIDAVGRARGKNLATGANDERESTLNQLLTEMDGFGSNSGVIILAATNRAEILDPALLRAGRFDRQIHVELPDITERRDIFKVHTKNLKMSQDVDLEFLAKQTPGFSGADIANVCNEAALIAARNDKQAIDKQDFMAAVDRIVGGLERKTKIITAEEKRSIAFHEAGHATISWFLQYANPLVKVTIVPRGEALGAAWYLPEERQLVIREHLLDEMCATLGGRAAEELFLNQTSTGALNDLERVTKRAYSMVVYYGMSPKIPNLSYYDSTGQSEYGFTKPYSEKTAEIIDKEVQNIIDEQFMRAKQILTEHAEGHHQLAQLLIDREVIYSEDLVNIFGERQWKSRSDEIIAENAASENKQADTTPVDTTPMDDAPEENSPA